MENYGDTAIVAHSCSMIHKIKNKIDLVIEIQRTPPLNYFKLELFWECWGEDIRVGWKQSGCTQSSGCACLFALWVTTLTSKILVAPHWQDSWITAFHLIAQYFYLTGYIPLLIQRWSLKFYRDVLRSSFWMGSEFFWAALLQRDERMLMEKFQSLALWSCNPWTLWLR